MIAFNVAPVRMKKLLALATAAALSGTAFAQATSDIRVTVEVQSPEVTYSADGTPKSGKLAEQPALVTFSGYKVRVENAGETSSNTVNNIVFRAATRISLTDSTRVAVFAPPAVGEVVCATGTAPADWSYTTDAMASPPTTKLYRPDPNAFIECPIGQLKPKDSKTFYVYFLAPKVPTPTVPESLAFDWRLNFAEGTNDSSGASRTDTKQATATVGLGTFNPTVVKSSVPPSKQVSLFTGTFGVATPFNNTNPPGDGWTTTIRVPSKNNTTAKAEISESKACEFGSTVLCSVNANVSIQDAEGNTVTFPATNANAATDALIITLRRDATTIPTGYRIRDAVVYYAAKEGDTPVPIPDCSVYGLGQLGPDNNLNNLVKRCEVRSLRTEYKNNNAPTPEYVGDWEFVIWATENGRLSW